MSVFLSAKKKGRLTFLSNFVIIINDYKAESMARRENRLMKDNS